MTDLPTFSIPLLPIGNTESGFRIKNEPGELQRPYLVDRGTNFMVQADLISVLHGFFASEGAHATLIVIELRFLSLKSSRPFRHATMKLKFENHDSRDGPEVAKIAPCGHFSMRPSQKVEEIKRSINFSAQVGGGGIGHLAAGAAWELTETNEKTDQTTLIGCTRIEGRTSGRKNVAKWSLNENKSQSDGIPTLLRVAVLLKRKSEARFAATIKIEVGVDRILDTAEILIQTLLAEKDDPIHFDPQLEPMGEIPANIDRKTLSSYDLKGICAVEYTTKQDKQVILLFYIWVRRPTWRKTANITTYGKWKMENGKIK